MLSWGSQFRPYAASVQIIFLNIYKKMRKTKGSGITITI